MPERHLETFRQRLKARPEPIAVYLADKKLLETLVGYTVYQGVFAVGKIPPLASLEEIFRKSPAPKLFVAVHEMSNAENLGALVRNCVAFGVQGMIVGETSSSPYLRRAVRNSMGAIFDLPVYELNNRMGELHESLIKHQFGTLETRPSETLAQTLRDLRNAACVASRRIRTRTKRFCRRRIFPAIVASSLATKGTGFPRKSWRRVTRRWRSRCRRRWIRSTSARRRRFFFTKRRGSKEN